MTDPFLTIYANTDIGPSVNAAHFYAYLGHRRGFVNWCKTTVRRHAATQFVKAADGAHYLSLHGALALAIYHRDQGRQGIAVNSRRAVHELRRALGIEPTSTTPAGKSPGRPRVVERLEALETAVEKIVAHINRSKA